MKILDLTNMTIDVPGVIKVDFNITDIKITNFTLDQNFTLATLGED